MVILIRYSEIGLKGKNRVFFEKRLIKNIKSALEENNASFEEIKRVYGRILLYTNEACAFLRRVFGIASFSHAVEASDLESAENECLALIKSLKKEHTFRVSCQRLDKRFPLNSEKIERALGAFVQQKSGAKVKLKGFHFELCVEIIQGKIYIFTDFIPGFAGLPIGSEGNAIGLIEDESSILASLLIMNRGAVVFPVALKKKNVDLLKKYAYGCEAKLNLIKDITEIDSLAKDLNAKAVVVGQTLESFKEIPTNLQALRPLIAYTKNGVEERLNDYRTAC